MIVDCPMLTSLEVAFYSSSFEVHVDGPFGNSSTPSERESRQGVRAIKGVSSSLGGFIDLVSFKTLC